MKIDYNLIEDDDLKKVLDRKFKKDLKFKGIESDVWIENYYGEKIHIAGRGEICCFWGLPKSGKSITLELIAGSILSNENKLGNFHSRKTVNNLLYIDMEQSEPEWMTAMLRVMGYSALKEVPENLISVSFKTIHRSYRLPKLMNLINAIDELDVLIIDGVADLCLNESDSTSANETFDALSHIAATRNCSIITIVHSNRDKQSKGPRDHLGVKAEKMCSTLPEIIKDEDTNSFLLSPHMDRNGGGWKPVRFMIGDNKMVKFDGVEYNPMISGSFKVKDWKINSSNDKESEKVESFGLPSGGEDMNDILDNLIEFKDFNNFKK